MSYSRSIARRASADHVREPGINMSINPGIQQIVDGWADSSFENTPDGALQYLKYCMFVKRDMAPLRPKGTQIRQNALMYWQHRNGIIDLMPNELKALARLSEETISREKLMQAKQRHEENVARTRAMPGFNRSKN